MDEGGTVNFVVRLNRTASFDVTVDYATVDGTATAGADYVAASGTRERERERGERERDREREREGREGERGEGGDVLTSFCHLFFIMYLCVSVYKKI